MVLQRLLWEAVTLKSSSDKMSRAPTACMAHTDAASWSQSSPGALPCPGWVGTGAWGTASRRCAREVTTALPRHPSSGKPQPPVLTAHTFPFHGVTRTDLVAGTDMLLATLLNVPWAPVWPEGSSGQDCPLAGGSLGKAKASPFILFLLMFSFLFIYLKSRDTHAESSMYWFIPQKAVTARAEPEAPPGSP